MKKYSHILDIVLLVGMGIITFLAVAPKAVVMPSTLQMLLLGGVLVLLAGFLVLLWREDPADEREAHNQALASRLAYLIGSGVLIIGLVLQSIRHDIDPIIPVTLFCMVATKVLVQRYMNK